MNTPSLGRAPKIRGWLALFSAVVIVAGGGALYGKYSQRWGPPPDLAAAAERLEGFPKRIGDWQLAEEDSLSDAALQMLESAGYVNRRYIHQTTGASISIAIIVGPPGPTAVHTPEICYSSRAYEHQSDRKVVRLPAPGSGEDSFWCVDFRSRSALEDGLRVYYAWSRGRNWEAAKSPRYEFAAAPLLYKLQLAAPIGPRQEDAIADPGKDFLEELSNLEWSLTGDS